MKKKFYKIENKKSLLMKQINHRMFDNFIDFDEASKEWRKNKKKCKNGCFKYICNYIHSNGKQCRRTILASETLNYYVCGFGGCTFVDKFSNHPNKNYYCKKHINRFNPTA